MPDVTLTIDYPEEEREKALAALRGFNLPDAELIEEEGEQPILRFPDATPEGAVHRTGEIKRAACEVAELSEDRIVGTVEGGWG